MDSLSVWETPQLVYPSYFLNAIAHPTCNQCNPFNVTWKSHKDDCSVPIIRKKRFWQKPGRSKCSWLLSTIEQPLFRKFLAGLIEIYLCP